MLPLHRDAVGGWREMPLEATKARRFLRLRLRFSRVTCLLTLVALFAFGWLYVNFVDSPPFRPPHFFPGGPDHPPPGFWPAPPPPPPRPFGDDKLDSDEPQVDDSLPKIDWHARAELVKEAFLHAYHGYEEYALPRDELLPLTNKSVNNFNGWGVTLVDALDTMYLMGLTDEFERGIKFVENMTFTEGTGTTVPFFETTIRYLGGLLSAYALSHDVSLLERADELGKAMLPVFNTTSGMPMFSVNTVSGDVRGGWSSYGSGWLAEIGSFQMEYKYLAKLTGRAEYYAVANTVTEALYNADTSKYDGLLPTSWNLTSGQPKNDQISIGAMADSAYEYLLKQWLLTAKTEKKSLELYKRTISKIIEHNLYLSPSRGLLYVTDYTSNWVSRRFEHLSCFLPGLLALGAETLPAEALTDEERQLHRWAAQGLGEACATIYNDNPTGLGAEEIIFKSRYDIEWARLVEARDAEKARIRALELEAKAKANGEDQDSDSEWVPPPRNVPLPPKLPNANWTYEEERLRWVNALAEWREGRYVPPAEMRIDDEAYNAALEGVELPDVDTREPEGHIDAHAHAHGGGGRPPSGKSTTSAASSESERGPVPGHVGTLPPAHDTTPARDYRVVNTGYYLRPETLESFFLLWRTTRDPVWRERGWAAFQSFEKECRTPSGYATPKNVAFSRERGGVLGDSMPSYFLAETLKYLYLLFEEEGVLPLDRYVLNTEAHPFPVFEWTEWEKRKFGIAP